MVPGGCGFVPALRRAKLGEVVELLDVVEPSGLSLMSLFAGANPGTDAV